MATEIELKYQLLAKSINSASLVEKITSMLNAQKISFKSACFQLENAYYDNDELSLRKMDFGLRIRSKEGQLEQTIKTAGKVEGGMHQRPEYNVSIPENKLDLALFPSHIWPKKIDVKQLEQSLHIIFTTNFSRQTWLIHQNKNILELALDIGEIGTAADQPTITINEIEIELIEGEAQALFEIADQLMTVVEMEPSDRSKAARGYALYYDAIKR